MTWTENTSAEIIKDDLGNEDNLAIGNIKG